MSYGPGPHDSDQLLSRMGGLTDPAKETWAPPAIPPPAQIRLNRSLSGAHLSLVLGGGCMAGGRIGLYEYIGNQHTAAVP